MYDDHDYSSDTSHYGLAYTRHKAVVHKSSNNFKKKTYKRFLGTGCKCEYCRPKAKEDQAEVNSNKHKKAYLEELLSDE